MTLQPAFEIVLEAHGHTVTLRASLRAAVTINAMPGGFPSVCDQIARQSLSAIRAVIRASATDQQDAHRYLAAVKDMPLQESLPDAQAACLAVLVSILPKQEEAPQSHATASDTVSPEDFYQSLYSYATGWLCWSPIAAWKASPAEIAEALNAQSDKVARMTPGLSGDPDQTTASTSNVYTAERLQEIEELGHDPAFDRGAFERLKAQHQQT